MTAEEYVVQELQETTRALARSTEALEKLESLVEEYKAKLDTLKSCTEKKFRKDGSHYINFYVSETIDEEEFSAVCEILGIKDKDFEEV